MTDTLLDNFLIKRYKAISYIMSIIIGIIGFSVLLGWHFDIQFLKSIYPNLITMKPNAALSFILISISLLLQLDSKENKAPFKNSIAKLLGFIVMLVGGLTLIENITNIDLHIDQLLFHEAPGPTVFYAPGRMAPGTALSVFLMGIVLIVINVKGCVFISEILAFLIGLFGLSVLIGLSFHTGSKTDFVHYAYASLLAALNFILFSIAVLCSNPAKGMMQVVVSSTLGGQIARQLIPFIIFSQLIISLIHSTGDIKNWYDPISGDVFFAIGDIFILSIFVYISCSALVRIDISRINANNQLEKKAMDLDRLNNELKQIIRVSTHDLQEPLRIISSFTQLLSQRYKDKIDKEANEYIDFAVDGANRVQKLLNDLLIYTHIEHNVAELQQTDLNVIIQKVLYDLSHEIEKKHADISVNILPTLNVNPKNIRTLFKNLLDNAIKFCEKKPKIYVSVQESGTAWIFSIEDNGIGIDEKYYDQIFNLFNRLHTKDKYVGSGVGLAICKKIVEFYHGKIWVKSIVGKGSIFYFSISK